VNESEESINGTLSFLFNGKELSKQALAVAPKSRSTLTIPFTVPKGSFYYGEIEFRLEQNGSIRDAVLKQLPAEVSSQRITLRSMGALQPLATEKIDVSDLNPLQQITSLRVYNSPLGSLKLLQNTLSEFKYLCAEQVTSQIAPILIEESLRKSLNAPRDLSKISVTLRMGEGITTTSIDSAFRSYLARIPQYADAHG
jgi:uncharacterized protein YfaS (alpha-2-macroglobulin family)